jgi:hypothetical protein
MSRRSATSPDDADAPSLFVVEPPPKVSRARRTTGRHERAVLKALRSGQLDADAYPIVASTIRSLAHALDLAEDKGNAYAIAQTAPQLHAMLKDCGLLPPPPVKDGADDPLAGASGPALVDE